MVAKRDEGEHREREQEQTSGTMDWIAQELKRGLQYLTVQHNVFECEKLPL